MSSTATSERPGVIRFVPGENETHTEQETANVAVATVAPEKPKRTERTNSPKRWREAYQRGLDEHLQTFMLNRSPLRWFVTSGSLNQAGYEVDVYDIDKPSCGCLAANKGEDPVCKHRAMVLARLGALPKVKPETTAIIATFTTTEEISATATTTIDIPAETASEPVTDSYPLVKIPTGPSVPEAVLSPDFDIMEGLDLYPKQ